MTPTVQGLKIKIFADGADKARADGLLATVRDLHAWDEALRGDKILSKAAKKLAPTLPKDQHLVVNLSGRGDKDIFTIAKREGISLT